MKTRSIKQFQSKAIAKTYVIDATNIRMGKLITTITKILLGKYNTQSVRYLPFSDLVVVNNVLKLSVTPTRWTKLYYWHTPFIGGIKSDTLEKLLKNKPEYLLKRSIWGMLPKNRYGRKLLSNVTINSSEVEVKNSIKVEIN